MDEQPRDGPIRRDVKNTYETIGAHFAKTRANPWPEVEAFVDGADGCSIGLDVGCGNGRHAAVLQRRASKVLALDASRTLLEVAGDDVEAVTFLQGDAARLPVRDDTVGLGVYVATLHHLPSRAVRIASLDELARVLDPTGRALVSAWSTTHDRFDAREDAETGFDTTVDWTLPGGEIVDRFYHIYAPEEFRADIEASELSLIEFEISSGNCYGTVRAESR